MRLNNSRPDRSREPAVNFKLFPAIVAAAVVLCGSDKEGAADPAKEAVMIDSEDVLPKQWLDKEITIAQDPGEHMVNGVAFGAQNDRWQKLKASMQPEDRLWTYCSPFKSFQALAGRCGIAVVRNGKVVSELVALMN